MNNTVSENLDSITSIEDSEGLETAGVTVIIDPNDLNNGLGPKVPADKIFYDVIDWLKEEIPQIESHSFFTPMDFTLGFTFETNVVFQGRHVNGSRVLTLREAAALVRMQVHKPPPGKPANPPTYGGAASVRASLELAFTGKFTPSKLYPGYDARHPKTANPIGRVRPDWGSGPMYEFAEGANPDDYPETDPAKNKPLYRFNIEGESLVFARQHKVIPKGFNSSSVIPAWRLQGR